MVAYRLGIFDHVPQLQRLLVSGPVIPTVTWAGLGKSSGSFDRTIHYLNPREINGGTFTGIWAGLPRASVSGYLVSGRVWGFRELPRKTNLGFPGLFPGAFLGNAFSRKI